MPEWVLGMIVGAAILAVGAIIGVIAEKVKNKRR